MKWEKRNTLGIIDALAEINKQLQEALPEIVAEEQARLRALEAIIMKARANAQKEKEEKDA